MATNQHTKGADKALTEQQQIFVDHFLKFGNSTRAAEIAGYANPDIQAVRLLSKPHIKRFCERAVQARAMGLAPDMMDTLAQLALDAENVAPKDRITAAMAVLDRAGVPNGKGAPTVNIDNRQQHVSVTGGAVAKLIAETFNRGQGAQPALPPPEEPPAEFTEVEDETGAND